MLDHASVSLRLIQPDSLLHRQELQLRYKVLREPLGMPEGSEWFPFERDCLHGVVVDQKGVVQGCSMMYPLPEKPGVGRLLQVAVREDARGAGIGRMVVQYMEEQGREVGLESILVHAREVALGFWLAMGYAIKGEPFVEVGITHYEMVKPL